MKAIMKIRMAFFVFLSLLFFQGCFGFLRTPRVLDKSGSAPVSVKIFDEDVFHKEGTIVIVPFAAGPEAEAGARVDHLALVIVKSVASALDVSASGLRVETGEDLSQAVYILDGRIEELRGPSGMLWMRKKGVVRVKGELRRQDTGDVVAVMAGQAFFRTWREVDQAAQSVGRSIVDGLVKQGDVL